MDWIITGFSLVATVANIHKAKWCFYIWVATNAAWTVIDLNAGIYSQASLQAVYCGLAVYGIFRWR